MPFLAAVPVMVWVAAAVSAATAVTVGVMQKNAADANAKLLEQEAQMNREMGKEAGKEAAFQTREQMSHAQAQMGQSGSSLASTSLLDITELIAGRGKQRERMARFGFAEKAWASSAAAGQAEAEGNRALMAGIGKGISAFASGASGYAPMSGDVPDIGPLQLSGPR